MPIRGWSIHPYRLPLREAWQDRREQLRHRVGLLLTIKTDDLVGHGDCAPLPNMGTETLQVGADWLREQLPRLSGVSADVALAALASPEDAPPAARCALETALIDLCAQQNELPMANWLNPLAAGTVKVNASVGALDQQIAQRVSRAQIHGFEVLKIKVGFGDAEVETARLNAIAPDVLPDAKLRLDANRAWSSDQALGFIQALGDLPIDSIEEPLSQPSLITWGELQQCSPFTLAIDESLSQYALEDWADNGGLRRVIIKPMTIGGLIPAQKLARQASELDLEYVISTTVDSAIGVWASVHLAASLDVRGWLAHGLATSQWLARDIAPSPIIEHGRIQLSTSAGLGVPVSKWFPGNDAF